MKLFVYELVSAGGLGTNPPASLLREGWAMLAALVEDFDAVPGTQTLTLVQSSGPGDVGQLCRRITPEEERTAFHDMVDRADLVLVIAPESDGLLATRSRWALDAGKPLLGAQPAAIDLTADKLALARHLIGRGIATPVTHVLGSPGPITFPAVCKPRHGAGSQATFLNRGRAELEHHAAQARAQVPREEIIVQPFVKGQAASVSFLVGPRDMIALRPATQRLSADGRFHYLGGKLPLPEPLAVRAVALARRALETIPGLGGFVGVDLVLGDEEDGSQDWIIEVNPRPTTSYVGLRRLARDNIADTLVRLWRGENVLPIRWHQGPVEFGLPGS
jgi:predicted ATP-grasp superfamily ATP-dependent carboligase